MSSARSESAPTRNDTPTPSAARAAVSRHSPSWSAPPPNHPDHAPHPYPTRLILSDVGDDKGGVYKHPANSQVYPRLQHITVAELLDGKRPQMPPTVLPYIAADKLTIEDENETLF